MRRYNLYLFQLRNFSIKLTLIRDRESAPPQRYKNAFRKTSSVCANKNEDFSKTNISLRVTNIQYCKKQRVHYFLWDCLSLFFLLIFLLFFIGNIIVDEVS
jgi:hypothetical protein